MTTTSSSKSYIYVKNLSRGNDPFWIGNPGYFDGAIIALFPTNPNVPIQKHLDFLNNQPEEYRMRSILTNTKYSFTQSSLLEIPVEIIKLIFF